MAISTKHINGNAGGPGWVDIKDTTKVGDTAYVVGNLHTLQKQIEKHWGKGAAVIKKHENGWAVTRLK